MSEKMFGNLCYIISGVTSEASDNLSTDAYGELMELASMLHDLDVHTVKALTKLLNVYFDGEHYSFDPPDCLDDDYSDEEYADLVYEGRKICDADSSDNCGSVDRAFHDTQILKPSSWVHSSTKRWFNRAVKEQVKPKPRKLPIKKLSDRRLAVDATKRKIKNVSE